MLDNLGHLVTIITTLKVASDATVTAGNVSRRFLRESLLTHKVNISTPVLCIIPQNSATQGSRFNLFNFKLEWRVPWWSANVLSL